MKNKFVILLAGVVILMVTTSAITGVLSSGAPVGSTGATGELTCGKSGCHTGDIGANNINTGPGVLSISSEQDLTNYVPGATYNITVDLHQSGVDRFGFSLTALDENNHKAGTFIVTDSQRTQIFQGMLQFTGREYMTYRMVGTNPYEPGKGLWKFQWKAPDQASGKVTFYAAGISANNDATDKGDLVYTKTFTSNPAALSVNDFQRNDFSFTVFPNPVKDYIHIYLSHSVDEPLFFSLYDMAGKRISSLPERSVSADGTTISFLLNGLKKGFYVLKMENASFSAEKKIMIIN